jgi:hypothetical protein
MGRTYRVQSGNGIRVVTIGIGGGVPGMHGTLPGMPGSSAVDGMDYERLLEVFGDGTENRGTDLGVIRSLPTITINELEKELPLDHRQCSICLEDFEHGQKRKTLQCLHGFHDVCIDKWLKTSRNCPVCKFDVQGSS